MTVRWLVLLALLAMPLQAHAGTHHRLTTPHGPVHVWTPDGYEPETAAVVVYVHGFYTDVDRAWSRHALPAQFDASGLNAMFIACAASDGRTRRVYWTRLADLLATVAQHVPVPAGSVAAVGHSGAHLTLSHWLAAPERLEQVVLVDALYGDKPELRAWLEATPAHRLIDAAIVTRRWSERFHATRDDVMVFEQFPEGDDLPGAHDARVVYVRSQYDHMELVTGGVALPMLLRALRIPLLPNR